jgi:SAM-dependent methyltransferase
VLKGQQVPENRWETFAQDNAEYAIYTVPGIDFRRPEGKAMFEGSGRVDVAQILGDAEQYLRGWDKALEIGCGIGRLTIPMARRFADVVGVDIAPTMLSKLSTNAREAGLDNIRGMLSHEAWDKCGPYDFVYSLIVFQHIESWPEIVRYFSRISACLAPHGVCWVQFDTRPPTLAYRAVRLLPDVVLPRPWRKGIRRIRRRHDALARLFDTCGLRVLRELQPGERHVFVLVRTS